jgi:L-alanine-DL-glutamate epimerase-like enolase superfamily enzyme
LRVAAGEYGYDIHYFKRMLEAQAVDVLQADITRCGGVTGFLEAGALCKAFSLPLSAHCAPSLHLHAACACPTLQHMEYFFDHYEIESRLFDGFCVPRVDSNGEMVMRPDLSRPGNGVELKSADAQKYAA